MSKRIVQRYAKISTLDGYLLTDSRQDGNPFINALSFKYMFLKIITLSNDYFSY